MNTPIQPSADFSTDFKKKVRAALRQTGRLLPRTDKEVEQALSELDESENTEAVLPDPYELFRTGVSENSTPSEVQTGRLDHGEVQSEVDRSMAMAAREGDEIPPEIREKMDRDRKEAEQEGQEATSEENEEDDQ